MCTELSSETLISKWPHVQMKQYFMSKGKDSKTTVYISVDFYSQAKLWLGQEQGLLESMSKIVTASIKRMCVNCVDKLSIVDK